LLGLYDYRFEILAMLMHIEYMEKTYGNDHRTLDEIVKSLLLQGFIPSFCATCYRKNRTGEHFMDFAKPEFKELGYSLIEEYKTKLDKAGLSVQEKFFSNINRGLRDEYI